MRNNRNAGVRGENPLIDWESTQRVIIAKLFNKYHGMPQQDLEDAAQFGIMKLLIKGHRFSYALQCAENYLKDEIKCYRRKRGVELKVDINIPTETPNWLERFIKTEEDSFRLAPFSPAQKKFALMYWGGNLKKKPGILSMRAHRLKKIILGKTEGIPV